MLLQWNELSKESTPSTCLSRLLVSSIIILSKYLDSFAKLLSNRNPVAALGTLVLLSYSKLLRFIIAALQYRVLDYPDSTSDIVWLYDGNVQYFTRDHLPRFVAAAMIEITHTWIGQCANSKLVTDTGSHVTLRIHLIHSMPTFDTLSISYTLAYSHTSLNL